VASPPTTPTDLYEDEALIDAAIAGTMDISDALASVAWSRGLPVKTSRGTYMFVYEDDSRTWGVAGDFDGWEGVEMTKASGFSWAEIPIADGAGMTYKFTSGPDWIADPWARSYTYDAFGEISFVDEPATQSRLDRWPDFHAAGLAPRELRIHVPAGDGPWPVLYMHDGNNLFDPNSMWGGWRMQDALALQEPVLVVGIDNTWDRMDEYTHVADDIGFVSPYVVGGAGAAYGELVQEHLRPFVEATYGSTGHDGLLGSSLGGLISLYIAHLYPGEFDFAGSMSGTLGWGRFVLENPTMLELYETEGVRSTALYLDSGGSAGADGVCRDMDGDGFYEDDPDSDDNYCVTRSFADAMAAMGYTWDVNLFHWHEVGADHNEMYWAERVDLPLSTFLDLD